MKKLYYSLKLETVLMIDGEGETEQDCFKDAVTKARKIVNDGGLTMDVRPINRQEIANE